MKSGLCQLGVDINLVGQCFGCSTVRCSTVQYSTVQYSTVQCSQNDTLNHRTGTVTVTVTVTGLITNST